MLDFSDEKAHLQSKAAGQGRLRVVSVFRVLKVFRVFRFFVFGAWGLSFWVSRVWGLGSRVLGV